MGCLGPVDELLAQPAADPRRIDIELLDPAGAWIGVGVEHHQRDHHAVDLGDGDVGMGDDLVGHPPAHVAVAVHQRHLR